MGGWVGERLEDIGKSVEDVIIDPVSDALSSFEDSVRDVVDPVFEGFNDVIENPYVQLVATILDPTPGKVASSTLRAYAKVNSGEELTATDLAQLGISSVAALGDVPIDPDTAKVIKSAAAVADGGDLQDVFVSNFGEEAFNKIAPELKQTARTAFGDDVYTLVQENIDPIKAGFRIASGESPTQVLAETYGDELVGALGSDDPTVNALGYAGLKTAVGLDQGLDSDEALLAGGEEYYKRGGQLPDATQIASLAGIKDIPEFDYNKLIGNLGIDFGALKGQYDLPSLRDFGIDLNKLNIQVPDLLENVNLDLRQVADLGLDFGNLDFSGYKPTDLGDYSIAELQGLGVDLPSLDLNMELQMIGLADLLQGDYGGLGGAPLQPGEELAMLEPNLDFLGDDETPFSRQLLESGKIA